MITPLQNFVVIKELKETERNGILLSEGDSIETNQGEVVKKAKGSSEQISEGQKVLFRPYGFEEIEIEKEKFLIGEDRNIIAIL